MLTNRALLTKWGLYALGFLLLVLVQQLVLDHLPALLGATPFLMPMLVAVVAALEGPTGGTIFGIAVGFLSDLAGGGVFSGVYTLSFFCVALAVAVISKYWVMRNVFGSLIYALLAFAVIDAVQILFLLAFRGVNGLNEPPAPCLPSHPLTEAPPYGTPRYWAYRWRIPST